MKTNFLNLNFNIQRILRESTVLCGVRNDGDGGVAVADASPLQEEADAIEAELDTLEDEIDEGGELETEEQAEKREGLEKKLAVTNQKILRVLNKAQRKESKKKKINMLGRSGSAFGQHHKKDDSDPEKKGGTGKVEESWEKDPLLGYNYAGEFLRDIKDMCEGGVEVGSKQLQFIANKKGGIHNEYGVAIPKTFTHSKESRERNFLNAGGVHMPTDPGLQPIMDPNFSGPVRQMPGGEEDEIYNALRSATIPMQKPELGFAFLRDKDHRNGLYGGIVVTDKPDTECLERLSNMEFGKLRMKVGGTYTMAAFHDLVISDSPISLVSMFQQGSNRAFKWTHVEYKLYGSGTGHFEGMLDPIKNKALIQIGRRNPGTKSLHIDDLLNMRRHCYGYTGATWLFSTTMYQEIVKLNLGLVLAGQNPIFQYNPVTNTGVLMGRPCVVSDDFCYENDLHLVNASHYYYGEYQSTMFGSNPYLLWLCEKTLFKMTRREVGRNAWECPLIPKRTNTPKSPFLTLKDVTVIPECPEMEGKKYTITHSGIEFKSSTILTAAVAGTAGTVAAKPPSKTDAKRIAKAMKMLEEVEASDEFEAAEKALEKAKDIASKAKTEAEKKSSEENLATAEAKLEDAAKKLEAAQKAIGKKK